MFFGWLTKAQAHGLQVMVSSMAVDQVDHCQSVPLCRLPPLLQVMHVRSVRVWSAWVGCDLVIYI